VESGNYRSSTRVLVRVEDPTPKEGKKETERGGGGNTEGGRRDTDGNKTIWLNAFRKKKRRKGTG